MTDLDRRIIAALQAGLGDSPAPWADAARALGIGEAALFERLGAMRASGVLRGVRAVLDGRALGVGGNILVAWRVDEARVEEVGNLFAKRPEVSHCVWRETCETWPYNLYTMVHAAAPEAAREAVDAMTAESGVADRVLLETVEELKKTPPRYF